jgi:Amidase
MKQRIHAMAGATAIAIAISSAGAAQAQPTTASPFPVVEASIDDIHTALRSGRLTTRQLVQSYLDRINAYDKQGPNINSVIAINPNALAEADRLDAAFPTSGLVGPLHGIPILVKDEIDTAGMPTTLGTLVFKDYRPPKDAFVIDKLRKAGAIILGKTTLSEFAAGDTYGSIFGVTRNPYDLERTVGGRHDRRGNSCIDPPPSGVECRRELAADTRPGESYRNGGGLSHSTRADGTDGAHRARSRETAGRHGGLRSGGPGDRTRCG